MSMAATAAPHASFMVGLPPPCDHKAELGCMLSALPCCCSCADRRPAAAAYPTYVDGKGMRMQGRRWQRYCRRCYGRFIFIFLSRICFFIFFLLRYLLSLVIYHFNIISHIDNFKITGIRSLRVQNHQSRSACQGK